MRIYNTNINYGAIAIALHWMMALLIIGLLALGLYMADLPVGPMKLKLYGWHKSVGVLVLMLAVVRLVWRLNNLSPSLGPIPWWEKFAAHGMHWALYGWMFAMPVTGWLLSSTAGFPVSFFGWFVLPDVISTNQHLNPIFTQLHGWLGYGLIAAIAGHTVAALKHHFIDKDAILRRMLRP